MFLTSKGGQVDRLLGGYGTCVFILLSFVSSPCIWADDLCISGFLDLYILKTMGYVIYV